MADRLEEGGIMSHGELRSSSYGLPTKPFLSRGHGGWGKKDLNQLRTGNLFVVDGKKYLSFITPQQNLLGGH